MHESHAGKSNEKHYSSFSKMLDYECEYESRESTREQFYQQLFKYKTKLRKDNHNLKREIQMAKEAILLKTLGRYFEKIKQLNEVNQRLRQKHRVIYEAKKPAIASQMQTPRSPLQTPRSRRSIANIMGNNYESNYSKISQKQPRYSNVAHGRKSLNIQNLQNIKPKFHGRDSLKISQAPRRQHNEQLTERKMMNSVYMNESSVLYNTSSFSQTNSMRCSIKSQSRAVEGRKNDNIFTKFIEVMLEEQKLKQKQIEEVLQQKYVCPRMHQEIYVNNLQQQVQKTSKNIDRLQEVLQKYELDIKKMQINVTSVTDMTKQLGKIKQNYVNMQQKCKGIDFLRIEVALKEKKLQQLKQGNKMDAFQLPGSIQMMLRLFGVEEGSLNDPSRCKKQLKNLVKGSFSKPSTKKLKIKELLDTIRQGRKKFKELMTVYEGRIKKLQRKLVTLRIHETK